MDRKGLQRIPVDALLRTAQTIYTRHSVYCFFVEVCRSGIWIDVEEMFRIPVASLPGEACRHARHYACRRQAVVNVRQT